MRENYEKTKINEQKYGLSRYFLLVLILSFLGWAFETGFVWLAFGKFQDRGFMTLPFCPIYGVSLFGMYLLAGTPDEPKGVLKGVDNRVFRYLFYFLIGFIVPSLAELIVGFAFDKLFHNPLWDYSPQPLNLNGYVCLPVSLVWATLIFFFMELAFTPIKNLLGKTPVTIVRILAAFALFACIVDIVYNFANVL